MEIKGSTRLIALLGDPVSHSLSPSMHNNAFAHYGLDFAYVPLRAAASDLKTALDALRVFNFRGCNVTLPHKQAVIPLLDSISEISKMMGAVNTILNDDGRLTGTTTDPVGFLEGFREAGHSFAGKTVAIIGNGGSARTLVFALLMNDEKTERPARVILIGRDGGKSKTLVDEIHGKLPEARTRLSAIALSDYASVRKQVDVVVNATPLGMIPNVDASPLDAADLEPGQIVYDIVYTPEKTKLIQIAEASGLKTVGGLGMLVHQGRASFKLWTGINPTAELFYAPARAALAHKAQTHNAAGPR